jgi:uncharacterized protein YidB (DUF937 family)
MSRSPIKRHDRDDRTEAIQDRKRAADAAADLADQVETYPKFPDVEVQLSGCDGNAFAVLGYVKRALRNAGHGDQVDAFMTEATDGDYNHLLATAMRWVDVS